MKKTTKKSTKRTGQDRRGENPLIIKIAKLWTSAEGTSITMPLDVKIEFPEEEIKAVGPLKGELMLIKLKDEISAILKDASIRVKLKCGKCVEEYETDIQIPGAEREFLPKMPAVVDDLSDICLIDMKDLTIDIFDMVRQEIILHFPFIQVCFNGCKGLCPVCGANRNLKKCGCVQEDTDTVRPFKDLKKIINN